MHIGFVFNCATEADEVTETLSNVHDCVIPQFHLPSFSLYCFQGHQYETVSGFVCEAFGYIPRTGEGIKVVVEKENQEENDEDTENGSDRQDSKEKHQIYKLEVLFGFFQLLHCIK